MYELQAWVECIQSQIREQMLVPDLYVFTLKFEIPQIAHENKKNSTGPAAQTSPELLFHIINMSQDSSVYWSVVLPVFIIMLCRISKNIIKQVTRLKSLSVPIKVQKVLQILPIYDTLITSSQPVRWLEFFNFDQNCNLWPTF